MNIFTLPDREGGDLWEQQFTKRLLLQTERAAGGGAGGGEGALESEEECFPRGAWIDEEATRTVEALLWVPF